MTESQLLTAVIELAQHLGWRVAHFRPARTATGWRTAVSGDGVGFPDLILTRGGVVRAVELKSDRGKTTAEQDAWLDALCRAGVMTGIWRPRDWTSGAIERALR